MTTPNTPGALRTVEVPSPTDVAASGGTAVAISASTGEASIVATVGDESTRTVEVGGTPVAVTVVGTEAYVVDATGDRITVVDLTLATVARRFPVCHGPRDVLAVGEQVTVVCELDAQVGSYNRAGSPLGSHPIGVSPFALAELPIGGWAVVDRADRSVLIDRDGQVTQLEVGSGATQVAVTGSLLLLAAPADDLIAVHDLDHPVIQPVGPPADGPLSGLPVTN